MNGLCCHGHGPCRRCPFVAVQQATVRSGPSRHYLSRLLPRSEVMGTKRGWGRPHSACETLCNARSAEPCNESGANVTRFIGAASNKEKSLSLTRVRTLSVSVSLCLSLSRSDTNEMGEIEVTVTSELHAQLMGERWFVLSRTMVCIIKRPR